MSKLADPNLALAAAALTLAGAFGFQHLGGLAPCPICIWQRWPYALGILLLAARWLPVANRGRRHLTAAAALTFLAGAGLSAWHAGIEWGFWPGLDSCQGAPAFGDLSGEDLLNALEATPLVRCDAPAWTWLGLSLAGWSALILAVLAALLASGLRRQPSETKAG